MFRQETTLIQMQIILRFIVSINKNQRLDLSFEITLIVRLLLSDHNLNNIERYPRQFYDSKRSKNEIK